MQRLFNDSTRMANEIIELYKEEDNVLFLCIGASPAYVYTALKSLAVVSTINIPISAMTFIYTDVYTTPTTDHIDKLKHFFGIYFGYHINYDKIVLIDHSHTGRSVRNFEILFRVCYPGTYKIEFINLVDTNGIYFIKNQPTILKKMLVSDTLNEVSGHTTYPRAIHRISFWDIKLKTLDELKAILEDETSIAEGKALQRKLTKYIELLRDLDL